MPRTATLLGIQELAALLDVSPMDVKNWRRRDRLPEPVAVLACGPVWTQAQFPAAVRRELTGVSGRTTKSTTTPRSGKPRKATRPTAAKSRKTNKR